MMSCTLLQKAVLLLIIVTVATCHVTTKKNKEYSLQAFRFVLLVYDYM